MKVLILAVLSTAAIVLPVASFAQQAVQPVTRTQVTSELAALERAGYSPRDWVHYPDNIQAAQRRIDAERAKAQGVSPQ